MRFILTALLCSFSAFAQDCDPVTGLPTRDTVIALTMDACETLTPARFDSTILQYLLSHGIPFTVFVSGRFAIRNRNELAQLATHDDVGIENHSYSHLQHMEALDRREVMEEVRAAEDTIWSICGRRTRLFRFPGGNYSCESLSAVQSLGYRVVHWTFESGDPDSSITVDRLTEWVLHKTRPASILIFHINGRGYSTGKALPVILENLRKRGYRFVLLKDYF